MSLLMNKHFIFLVLLFNFSLSFSSDIFFIKEIKQVEKNQNNWAKSWSNTDLPKYIDFYVTDYAPKGLSHNQWLKQRKTRLNKSNNIRVKINIESLVMDGGAEIATTIIVQDYQSNTYKSKVKKQFIWHKQEGVWKIFEEKQLP